MPAPAACARNAAAASSAGINFCFVEGSFEAAHVVGKVLQQVDVYVEGDDESFVLVAQNVIEESAAHFLFHFEHAHLAAAGVDEDAERKRQIAFRCKVFNGLGLAVLKQLEVILSLVGDEGTLLILHIEEQLHHVDPDLQGLHGLFVVLIFGLIAKDRRGILRGRKRRSGERKGNGQTQGT